MEAEVGVVGLQAKDCQGLQAAIRSWEAQGRLLPQSLWWNQHLIADSGLQPCENINFCGFKEPNCGHLLPRKLIQLVIILFAYLFMGFLPLDETFLSLLLFLYP